MVGLETLDVLIGLVTVYLVFGLALTAIVEAIATWFKLRSSNLEAALNEFLAGELKPGVPFVKAFFDHPLLQALSKGQDGRPSYIPPEIVGQVVEGLLTASGTAASLAAAVNNLPGTTQPSAAGANRIKGLLDVLVTQAAGNAVEFRKAVEAHFNATMERASGWFKRHTQTAGLVTAAVLVVLANVDTVQLAVSLASSPAARLKIVEIAQQNLREQQTILNQVESAENQTETTLAQAKADTDTALKTLAKANSDMESAGLRIGWTGWPSGANEWLAKVAGLLVSIFAVSLGAPFWFDVLQRFMQVRAAGASPQQPEGGKK
jgi:hypothetical protein